MRPGSTMVVLVVFFWLGFSLAVAVAANSKGRSGLGWFFLAILISPLLAGLFVLAVRNLRSEQDALHRSEMELAKTKKCPRCAETVKIDARVCRFCNTEFEQPE